MRPKSVVHAERLYLLSAVLVIASAVLAWQPLVDAYGVGVAGGTSAFVIGALLLLILLTTRRGSRVARGLLAAFSLYAVLSLFWQVGTAQIAPGILGVINTAQAVTMAIGAVLLFRPNAAIWFARPHEDWEEDEVDDEAEGDKWETRI